MEKEKTLVAVYGSIAPSDLRRLKALAESKGKVSSAVVREALEWYLDHHDKLSNDSKETEAVTLIKKLDQRLSGLIIQVLIDVGIIINLMWKHLHPETADADLAWARQHSLLRLRKRRKDGKDPVVQELAK